MGNNSAVFDPTFRPEYDHLPITPTTTPSEAIIQVYKNQAPGRSALLKSVPDDTRTGYFLLYNLLVPEVFCPNLVRIGDLNDGGKWVCNPIAVTHTENCVVYSLGIDNRPTFDVEFQNLTMKKCMLRAADKDDQNEITMRQFSEINGSFIKALISNKTDPTTSSYTFKDLLGKFGDKQIDVLKMDIEGAEFQVADEILSVPVCQLLVEFHNENPVEAVNLLRKFSSHGFYLFSYENNAAFRHICEYSFIHESCFKTFGIQTVLGKYLS